MFKGPGLFIKRIFLDVENISFGHENNILLKKEPKKKIKSEIIADDNDGIEIVENIKFDGSKKF